LVDDLGELSQDVAGRRNPDRGTDYATLE
jgi:hypothetical protein